MKLYTKIETKYNSKNLIPYLEFTDNDYIKTYNSKNYKYASQQEYIAIFKIKGIDLTILDPAEEKTKLENFHTLIKNLKTNFSLAKINQKTIYNSQLKHIENLIIENHNLYSNLQISVDTYQAKLKQLQKYKEELTNINNEKNQLSHDMFIILYSYKLEQLDEICYDFLKQIESINIEAIKLNKYESVNFIKNIFNPYANDISKQVINEHIDNINELLSFKNIKFNKNRMIINDDLYCSIQTINDYPQKVNDY